MDPSAARKGRGDLVLQLVDLSADCEQHGDDRRSPFNTGGAIRCRTQMAEQVGRAFPAVVTVRSQPRSSMGKWDACKLNRSSASRIVSKVHSDLCVATCVSQFRLYRD